MKRAIVKEVLSKAGAPVRLVSYGKQLFVLNPVEDSTAASASGFHFQKHESPLKEHTFENNIRFDLNVQRDAFLQIDSESKGLKSYSLESILAKEEQPKLTAQT